MGEVISMKDWKQREPRPLLSKAQLDAVVQEISSLLMKSEQVMASLSSLGTVRLREKAAIDSHNYLMKAHEVAGKNGLRVWVEESPGQKEYKIGPKQ